MSGGLADAANFTLSNDRTLIAFTRGGQIWIASLDQKTQRPVTGLNPATASAPVFSRDGQWLAFVSSGEGRPADSGLLSFNGDRMRVGQVVDNLLSNALKFTPAGGRVDVRAFAHGSGARIEVSDSGMGIAEEELALLFDRFFRTTRAQEEAIPGVGLGLSIAKAIVEAHGGRIAVRSREGGGTTFTVDLPAKAAVPALRVSSAA